MLYLKQERTVIETVAPGCSLDLTTIDKLVALRGGHTSDGDIVVKAAVVFVGGHDDASPHLDALRANGIECRAFDNNGAQQTVFAGIVETPPIVPVLRACNWNPTSQCFRRSLIKGSPEPVLSFAYDSPRMRTILQHIDEPHLTIEDVEKRALANLAKQQFIVEPFNDYSMTVVSEFQCESILLPSVMQELAARLGSQLIAVSIPREGAIVAVSAQDMNRVIVLAAWTEQQYRSAKRAICATPLLISNGEIVGYAAMAAETPKSKPWYRFW